MNESTDFADADIKARIVNLLVQGFSYKETRRICAVGSTTVCRIGKELALPRKLPGPKIMNSFDWPRVQKFYDGGETRGATRKQFGISRRAFGDAHKAGKLHLRDSDLRNRLSFSETAERNQGKRCAGVRAKVRKRIIEENILPYVCKICGISTWREELLVLRLDHISGDGRDHRLENLRFLCPNCDSQQPTHGHRNRGRYKAAAPVGREAFEVSRV